MCCRIAAERRGGAGKGLAATRFQPDSGTAVPCTCCPASRRAALVHPRSASFVVPSLYSAAYPFYRSHIDCIYCIEWSFLHFQEVVRWYQHPSLSQALRAKIQRSCPIGSQASAQYVGAGPKMSIRLSLRLPVLHPISFSPLWRDKILSVPPLCYLGCGDRPTPETPSFRVLRTSAECLCWQLLTRVQKAEDFLSSKDGPFWSETRE